MVYHKLKTVSCRYLYFCNKRCSARRQNIKFFLNVMQPKFKRQAALRRVSRHMRRLIWGWGASDNREIILGCPAPFFLFFRNSRGSERGRGEGGIFDQGQSYGTRGWECGETGKINNEKWLEVGRRRKLDKELERGKGKKKWIEHWRARKIRKVRGCKKEEKEDQVISWKKESKNKAGNLGRKGKDKKW